MGLVGQVLPLARLPRRGRRADLAQAPLHGVRRGQEPAAVDAELHRRGGQGLPEEQEPQGRGMTPGAAGGSRPGPALRGRRRGAGRSRLRVLVALLAVAIPCALPAAAREPAATDAPAAETAAPSEFLPVDALRPGMQGTARTVFEGDRLEEFGVEILGVLRNAIGPQQDLIIA